MGVGVSGWLGMVSSDYIHRDSNMIYTPIISQTGWSDDHEVDAAWVAADPSNFLRSHVALIWTAAGEGLLGQQPHPQQGSSRGAFDLLSVVGNVWGLRKIALGLHVRALPRLK